MGYISPMKYYAPYCLAYNLTIYFARDFTECDVPGISFGYNEIFCNSSFSFVYVIKKSILEALTFRAGGAIVSLLFFQPVSPNERRYKVKLFSAIACTV